jgi:OmpA-OmpF porin, OOP family
LACNTEGACKMAQDAADKVKTLTCPPRGAAQEPIPAAEPPLAPVPAAEPTPEKDKYCITLNILFDIDKAVIRDESRDEVGRVATFMQKFPSTTAVIEGHADEVGTAEHNMQLSQKRAESVVNYLADNFGIDRSRLAAKGYGKTRPIADNGTEAGRQKNRRIEAIIDCAVDIKGLKPVPDKLCLNLKVQFDTDKADISSQYHDEIARVADFMKENPTVTALVEGHTDNVGNAAYNLKLSQMRAESVVNYLAEKFGIERSRLYAKGYGETHRIAYNSTPEGRAKNRRVNVILDCVIKR